MRMCIYNAMGFNVLRMEGKCFIERGREINVLETVPKKLHFAHIGASFSKKKKKKKLNYSAYVPVSGQHIQLMADQEF